MAAPYISNASGTIGTLLRQIQEEKSESPVLKLPQTTPGSPIREVTQQPIFQPEAPDTNRAVSIRPETAPSEMGMAENQVVPPTYAAPEAGGVVGPTTPGFSSPMPSEMHSSSPGSPMMSQAMSSKPMAQSMAKAIAPKLMPTMMASAPAKSTTVASSKKPVPSPTPAPQKAPGMSRMGQVSLMAAPLGQKLLPALEDILGLAKSVGGRILGGDSLAKLVTGTSLLNPKPVGGDISPNRKVAGRR